MTAFFLNLVNMSITASWLVLAVILLRLILKRAPKAISVALWAIVALRLIFPFSIESVLSLVPSANTIPQEIVYAKEPTIDSGVESINNVVNPIIIERFAPSNELTSINPIQVFFAIAENIWILGMLAMIIYAIISYLRLRLSIQEAVKEEKGIYICDRVPSPFILGIFRPKIILPSAMTESDREYVIAHEKAHIHRRDHWWKPLGFLLLSIHWFNPVLWIAYILLCRDIELACDERVIRDMSAEDKKAYSTVLLNCSMPRRIVSACPLAFGEVGVKKRIKSVLNYKKPAFWIILISLILVAAVAVGFLTDPKEKNLPDVPDITAHAYEVTEVIYSAPYLSFAYFPLQNTPFFTVTDDLTLLRKEIDDTSNKWDALGKLEEIKLSKYNFDVYFDTGIEFGWKDGFSPEVLRNNNAKAWGLQGQSCVFVLAQKDGSIYTTIGTTKIHHVLKLETNVYEDTGLVAVSGENSVPVKVFSNADSLDKIKNEINWLDISFSDESFTPFNVFCDGSTQLGHFNIYDASSFERLDFFRPSGLSPHTYIFQNAVEGGKYIITLAEAPFAEKSTALLCFGAKLPGQPIFGVWEAPASVLGLEGNVNTTTVTYVFNRDKTGYRIHPLATEHNFTYTTLNGLLTLTFNNDSEMTEYFSYECDGSSLTLTDADKHRSITLKKAVYTDIEAPVIEENPSSTNSIRFFSSHEIIGEPREVSGFSFSFKKSANHSLSTGLHTEYIDNLVLSTADNNNYVLSFSIYQGVLPYVNQLFSVLNSIVTVDYEGKVLYDKNVNPNDFVTIKMNGLVGKISEVKLGAGNGHRDFYFTFSTEEYIEFTDITEFEISVNQAPVNFNVEISNEHTPAMLQKGNVSIYPILSNEYYAYNEFLLKCGDREKRFYGECLYEDHWRRELYIEDLTGDGVDDIIVTFQDSHGTGVATENVHVFDGVTLEEYTVEPLYETIGEHIEFSADADTCYIKINDITYSIDKSMFLPHYKKDDWGDIPYTRDVFSYYVKNGILTIELACKYTISGIVGDIYADYKFANGEFVYSDAIFK